jgi:hypothetical protein
MADSRRFSGKHVLLGFTLLVVGVVALVVLWAVATPGVPDARERLRGSALPGVQQQGTLR